MLFVLLANIRLFQSRGVRMTNPHCPSPSPLAATPPRLSWPDKWALYTRSRKHGKAEQLLRMVLEAEDRMEKHQLPGSLRGRAKRLQLLVVLDSTLNPIALSEAQQRWGLGVLEVHVLRACASNTCLVGCHVLCRS